jgi:hypothetical protein
MFEQYLAALLSLRQAHDLAFSALPDAPVQIDGKGGKAAQDRRSPEQPSPADAAEAAPVDRPVAAGPTGSSEWDPCPCRQWGVARGDHHGCVALLKELFPQLDQELDAWEAAYSRLYR